LLAFDRTVAPQIRRAIQLHDVKTKTLVLTSLADAKALTAAEIAHKLAEQSRSRLDARAGETNPA
jgi:hypothetical protein